MTTQIELSKVVEIENYRSEYPADHILALSESMAERGFDPAFPIKVIALPDGNYGLVAGHCRTRAFRNVVSWDRKSKQPLGTIPAIIETNTDPAVLALSQLSENENRRDPNELDRANGYKRAMAKGASIDQVCKATGKNRDYVERRLSLLLLVPDVQEMVAKHQFPITYAAEMSRLDSNFQRIALRAYNATKNPNLEDFRLVVDGLFTKQSQCSLFDLNLFNGTPIETIMADLGVKAKVERDFEAELIQAKKQAEIERMIFEAEIEELKEQVRVLKATTEIEKFKTSMIRARLLQQKAG